MPPAILSAIIRLSVFFLFISISLCFIFLPPFPIFSPLFYFFLLPFFCLFFVTTAFLLSVTFWSVISDWFVLFYIFSSFYLSAAFPSVCLHSIFASFPSSLFQLLSHPSVTFCHSWNILRSVILPLSLTISPVYFFSSKTRSVYLPACQKTFFHSDALNIFVSPRLSIPMWHHHIEDSLRLRACVCVFFPRCLKIKHSASSRNRTQQLRQRS